MSASFVLLLSRFGQFAALWVLPEISISKLMDSRIKFHTSQQVNTHAFIKR